MTNTIEFMERFLKLFKLLDSDQEGEREGAAHAIYRLCKSASMPISEISIILEATEADINRMFAKGVEKGRAEVGGSSSDYFDDFGEPRCEELLKFCQASPAKTTLR